MVSRPVREPGRPSTSLGTALSRSKGRRSPGETDGPPAQAGVISEARHFTTFSLRRATGNPRATIDDDLQAVVNLMNPMYFIGQNNRGMAGHWWIRMGTSDNHTSLTVIGNLAATLENRNKDVNAWLYWDAGHGADEDAEEFIAWIGSDHRFRDAGIADAAGNRAGDATFTDKQERGT